MEWLIANPHMKLSECAAAFNVSQPWLSCIIHSRAFQERYREIIGDHVDSRVLPLRDKLTGVAATAIDRLGLAVAVSTDPDFLLSAADKTLHRLGYAPNTSKGQGVQATGPTQINIFNSVSQEQLERARQRRRELYEGTAEEVGPGDVNALPAPSKV